MTSGIFSWDFKPSRVVQCTERESVVVHSGFLKALATDDLQPQSGDFASVDAAVSQRSNPVQEHVDAIVDDLTAGRVSGGQRATLGRALQDAAIGSIGRKHE